jgi:hypothetical protein
MRIERHNGCSVSAQGGQFYPMKVTQQCAFAAEPGFPRRISDQLSAQKLCDRQVRILERPSICEKMLGTFLLCEATNRPVNGQGGLFAPDLPRYAYALHFYEHAFLSRLHEIG